MDKIDEKLYYKIGEVAKIIGLEPYVIRYWEKEFRFLRPYKSKSLHRLYSKSQIEKLLLVKDYLYNKKYTIEGARIALRKDSAIKRLNSGQGLLPEAEEKESAGSTGPGNSFNDSRSNTKILRTALDELNTIKSILLARK